MAASGQLDTVGEHRSCTAARLYNPDAVVAARVLNSSGLQALTIEEHDGNDRRSTISWRVSLVAINARLTIKKGYCAVTELSQTRHGDRLPRRQASKTGPVPKLLNSPLVL